MADDIARLGYEIDSSQTRTAASDLDKMAAAAERAAKSHTNLDKASKNLLRDEQGRFLSAQQAADRYGAEIDMLRQKYIPMYAASKQLAASQDEIKRALELGAITAKQAEAALERLDAQFLQTGNAAQVMGKNMQASAMHSTNLLFQFQDIGMMLAAGQNPLMLAMQQGTQVAGVFHQMKVSGQSAFSGIKAGLLGLVSPMSLATIGIIAGGAALGQWAIAAITAGNDADYFKDRVDELNDIVGKADDLIDILTSEIGELEEKYLFAAERTREFAAASQAERRLRDQIPLLNSLVRSYDKVGAAAAFGGGEITGVIRVMEDFGIESQEVAARVQDALLAISAADNFDQQADALRGLIGTLEEAEVAAADIPPELQRAIDEMITLIRETDAAKAAMDRLAGAAAGVTIGVPLYMQGLGGEELLPPPSASAPKKGRSGAGAANRRQRELERFIESLMTEREVLEQWRTEQLELLNQYNEKELEAIGGQAEAKLRIQKEYMEGMAELQHKERINTLNTYSTIFGNMAQLFEAGGKKTFAIAKALRKLLLTRTGHTLRYWPIHRLLVSLGCARSLLPLRLALV